MALYQPSNITPSTFAGLGAGVIDVNDQISISWQVNGTSAMTGYSIAIYANTTGSALVASISTGAGFQPFYGTDAQGNPVFYIYNPDTTWAYYGLTNGNSYKLKITQYWKNNPDDTSETTKTVVQNSESVFITRAAPSLSVSPGSGTLSSVAQTFTATYSQVQGDAVSWVRWVLSDASGDVLDDTGTVYTGVLSYTYDRFFSGETYKLQCTVQTASGAEVTVTNNYAVSYDSAEQSGGISLSCNPDDSVTLSWAAGADIPGVPSAEDYGTISGGVLHLAAERSITWNTVNGEDMAFSSPYCFAWRGRIAGTTTDTDTVSSGTWELVKTYPQSNSTTASHTMSTGAWERNPGVKDRFNGTLFPSVEVTESASSDNTYADLSTRDFILRDSGSFIYNGQSYQYSSTSTYKPTIKGSHPVNGVTAVLVAYYSLEGDWVEDKTAAVEYEQLSNDTYLIRVYSNNAYAYPRPLWVMSRVRYTLFHGTTTVAPPAGSGQTGIEFESVTNIPSECTEYNAVWDNANSRFIVSAKSYIAGTYSASLNYTYANTSSNNIYKATWTGTQATGTLKSASIQSTTAAGGATVSISGNNYTVTEYSPNNTTATQTVVTLNYTTNDGIGNDSYRTIVTGTKEGAVSAAVTGSTAKGGATVTIDAGGTYAVTMYNDSSSSCTADIAFSIPQTMEADGLAEFTNGTDTFALGVSGGNVVLTVNGAEEASIPIPFGAWYMVASLHFGLLDAYFLNADQVFFELGIGLYFTALPSPITAVTINGEQYCDYVYITQNASYNFMGANYAPSWDDDTLFFASFTSDLQAGTVTSSTALSVAIYRKRGTVLEPVGVFGSGSRSVRDYGIRSGIPYTYELFYISEGTYSAGAETAPMCRQFRQHTLIEAEEDADLPGVYHPLNVWRFRNNVDAGAYTNQNQPVLLENFTKYPLWQPSSPAAKSGTLTALLGRFEDGEYSGDDAVAMDALFALSGSVNPLFYRDMKGNLYMVRLAGPISQTVDNRTGVLAVSVSVPWVEVGDAGDAKIYTEA